MAIACSRQDSGFNPPQTCLSSFGIPSRFAKDLVKAGKFLVTYGSSFLDMIPRLTAIPTPVDNRRILLTNAAKRRSEVPSSN